MCFTAFARIVNEDVGVLRKGALHLDPLGERLGCDLRDAPLGERGKGDRLRHRLELALLHLVHVEERVDHAQKLADVRLRKSQELVELLAARLELTHSDQLHECDDAVCEIADVVTEHPDELFA